MNRDEAIAMLDQELAGFRRESYATLVGRMPAGPITCERAGGNGASYQIEVQVFWDNQPHGDVRVVGSIDGGAWRALAPLSRDFIKAPDGSFVGE